MTQLTLSPQLGATLKEDGLDAIEQTDREFIERMRAVAIKISKESGWVTTDNLRVIASELGLAPRHQNTWGSIMRGARWKVIGRQRSAIPSNHSRELKVWRYCDDLTEAR
ncbi:MAG: hypothetical protein OEY86_17590 [Nitrospira sp.]|nr:hypothetical protein [Nitrospira sp.]